MLDTRRSALATKISIKNCNNYPHQQERKLIVKISKIQKRLIM